MEQYYRYIVYRRYVDEGMRPDEIARPYVSFATLSEAAEYVGRVEDDDRYGKHEYTIIDVELLHLGDMLKADEARALVEPALRRGRARAA